MAIYQCRCGLQTTDMQEMKRHLRNTGHTYTTGFTGAYQTCIVHLMTKPQKRVKTEKGQALKKILDTAAKKARASKK